MSEELTGFEATPEQRAAIDAKIEATRARKAEALERGKVAQSQADNTIVRPRLDRNQMMHQTKRDNPQLFITSVLFRECFVLNAMGQEGQNLRAIAKFTGMSKGEVSRHLHAIERKIRNAQMQAAEEATKLVADKIKSFTPGELNAEATTETETAHDADIQTMDRGDNDGRVETPVDAPAVDSVLPDSA